jgi:hypothetical protein
MFKLTFLGEVKLNFLLLGGVGSNIELVAIDILGEHQWERAVGNLAEKAHCFALGRDIRHDDLALVGLVDDDILGLILILVVVEELISMDHHNVILDFALALFDLFFE